MKRSLILNLVFVLAIVSLIGAVTLIIRSNTRTPEEDWALSKIYRSEGNYPQALRCLTRAADGGITQAQYELALLYDAGDKIPENRDLAKKYMAMAVESDLPEAHYVTAVWTERGYFGAPDIRSVIRHYEYAANRGSENAMKSLIVLYGEVLSNPERQNYWLNQLKRWNNQ